VAPHSRRRLIAIPVAALCVALGGAAALLFRPPHTVSKSGPPESALGTIQDLTPAPAPPFPMAVLSRGRITSMPRPGAQLALASLRGHPLVVNFWASWCWPCTQEMPLLVKAWHAYAGRGVIVLGVDLDDTPADARRFLADHHVDYPVVTSSSDRVPRPYGVVGLPTTVFVDASGAVRARQLGGFSGAAGERALMQRLAALVDAGTR
jgi:cytochrome c biogenesis protein CcmG/thiol:disulfide interchange protein DsbE